MKLNVYGQKLRPDLERIRLIHWAHFLCIISGIFIEIWEKVQNYWAIVWIFVFFFIYRLYFKTVKNLFYSFWTFSLGIMLYLIYSLVMNIFVYGSDVLVYTYLAALTFLVVEMYMLYSPIHFPRVIWWEYDFRYRHDLKIFINLHDQIFEGRLTDLRRGAGCVVLFQDIATGEFLTIKAQAEDREVVLKVEIMSKKEYTFGRGFTYGVKFHFETKEEKKNFKELCRLYKKEKSSKKKLKKFQMNKS